MDPVTLLIVRSARSLMAENSMDVRFRSSTDFSDYRVVQGLSIPFRIVETVTLPSRPPFQSVYVVANVTVNSGVSDSVFTFQGTRR